MLRATDPEGWGPAAILIGAPLLIQLQAHPPGKIGRAHPWKFRKTGLWYFAEAAVQHRCKAVPHPDISALERKNIHFGGKSSRGLIASS